MTQGQLINTYYPFQPTQKMTKDLIDFVIRYEIYSDNAEAQNTPYLALKYPIFLPTHAQTVFDIFGVQKSDFEKKLKEVPSINKNFNTISDSFNLFCVIIAHKYIVSSLPQKTMIDGFTAVMKLMNYKFFSGRVRTSFKYKANPGVMTYTINNLSGKYQIKDEDTKSWRQMVEKHVGDLLQTSSPHYQVFRTFTPDEKVFQIISDMSTRIAQKINNIAEAYYENVKLGNTINSVDAKYNENEEGEAELRVIKSHLDNKITMIEGKCLNINTFQNFGYMRLVAGMCNNVRPDMQKNMLETFSSQATSQAKNQESNNVMQSDGKTIYLGYRVLINEVIQKSYRHCMLTGVDMSANLAILKSIGDVFRASRLQDEGQLTIKDSVDYFITENLHYKREATIVAQRQAFIMYIIVLTFE